MNQRYTFCSPERVNERVDVMETLYGTFGKITEHGVLIELVPYNPECPEGGSYVRYSNLLQPEQGSKELSGSAYAAEFFKICGGDLNSADYDELVRDCKDIGEAICGYYINSGTLTFDDLRKEEN